MLMPGVSFQSLAFAVGHIFSVSRTAIGRLGDFLFPWLVPRAFESEAFGVGHGVEGGEDEHSLPLMWGADFRRAEYSPRHLVTHSFQVADDCGESHRDVSIDILEETESWLAKSNSICDPWPEVSWIVLSLSLSCCGERRARVAPRKDVHQSAKFSEREGFKICPNRSCVQESRFHF
jgi:hypothetical protein